jgi:TetR/AcrR family transcriptional regulator, transcriptional repressor for nem operon
VGRVSQTQAHENRKRVVATAARMFREKGITVSVADVMKAAGLTHGGFYKHFASKEDLVDEATAYAFDEPAAHSAVAFEEHAGKPEAARRRLIERYLSVSHRDHAGDGCPVSGFAADLGREPDQAAQAHERYVTGVRKLAARMATGDDDGMAQVCTMVGALVLARATHGNPISEELLRAARTALTRWDASVKHVP